MTPDFIRGFSTVMHGYSVTHSFAYHEVRCRLWSQCRKKGDDRSSVTRAAAKPVCIVENNSNRGPQSRPDAPIVFHSQKNHEMVQKRRSTCLLHVALYHSNRITFSPKSRTFLLRAVKCFNVMGF